MKLHLPKMLFAAVVMAYSVAEAAVTTVESITIGNETYTGNVSILDNAADITADNLTNVDYVVFKNAIEITNESAISTLTGDKSATIVLAKYTIGEGEEVTPSRLFVNVWNKSTATILNDIVLGTSSHNEGALRLHETSDSKSIILKGNINVVQDTKITVGGGDGDGEHNFLEGYVSATGKTVTIDHINTNSSGVVFSGGGDFGTLTGSVKKITFAATKADGVTEAAGKTYSIGTFSSTCQATVDSGVSLTITNASINAAYTNNGTTTLGDATISRTITNNGTLTINGSITVSEDTSGLTKISDGTATGEYTNGQNGWQLMQGAKYYLVDTTAAENATVVLGTNATCTNGTLDDSEVNIGKLSTTMNRSYDKNSAYYVNVDATLNSTTAAAYKLADSATMTWDNGLKDHQTITVDGSGTLVTYIAQNGNSHNNVLKLGQDFNGTLELKKQTDADMLRIELSKFQMGNQATVKLYTGENWQSNDGADSIKQAIILNAENEEDFKFRGNKKLTFEGKVTGKHLYSEADIALANTETRIDNVRIDGNKTLTVGADMSLGKVSVKDGTLTISNAALTLANGESKAKSLSLSNGAIVFGSGATLDVTNSVTLDASAIKLAEKLAFTSAADSVTLMQVSGTDQSLTVNNVDSWTGGSHYDIDGLTYVSTLSTESNVLKLVLTKDATQSLEVSSADLTDNVLTLNIGADLSGVTTLDLTLSDAALAAIEGKTGLVTLDIVGLNNTGDSVTSVSFYGSYTGEAGGGYRVEYIPEPTTATLSLLALCGLAARRRRKH